MCNFMRSSVGLKILGKCHLPADEESDYKYTRDEDQYLALSHVGALQTARDDYVVLNAI